MSRKHEYILYLCSSSIPKIRCNIYANFPKSQIWSTFSSRLFDRRIQPMKKKWPLLSPFGNSWLFCFIYLFLIVWWLLWSLGSGKSALLEMNDRFASPERAFFFCLAPFCLDDVLPSFWGLNYSCGWMVCLSRAYTYIRSVWHMQSSKHMRASLRFCLCLKELVSSRAEERDYNRKVPIFQFSVEPLSLNMFWDP